jgi:ABC-2 type transport system ATP-binding protein
MSAVETVELTKDYPVGFWRKVSKRALDGLTFQVEPSQVFGLLGPNGAGKSTTLKILLGLVFPTSGKALLFDRPPADIAAHRRLGYLPEQPYFYDHLSVRETLDFYARLCGLGRADRRRRIAELSCTFRLEARLDRPLRTLSKGSLQRVGMAQALIASPALAILDEPMSGLDPIGRKQIRDIIQSLRAAGTTVLFSSHILSDAQLLCDRVAILGHGRLHEVVRLADLTTDGEGYEVVVAEIDAGTAQRLHGLGLSQLEQHGPRWHCLAPTREELRAVVRAVAFAGGTVESVTARPVDLERIFMRRVLASAPERQRA